MGMRPTMALVFGVSNFKGKLNCGIYETVLPKPSGIPQFEESFLRDVFYDRDEESMKYISDVLFYDDEFLPGVLGLCINRSEHDSDLVRAIGLFHDEYMTSGRKDIPVMSKEEHPLYVRRINERDCSFSDIKFTWKWFYPATLEQHFMWAVHAYCARWLFEQVGVYIPPRRYKAMLCWKWS